MCKFLYMSDMHFVYFSIKSKVIKQTVTKCVYKSHFLVLEYSNMIACCARADVLNI